MELSSAASSSTIVIELDAIETICEALMNALGAMLSLKADDEAWVGPVRDGLTAKPQDFGAIVRHLLPKACAAASARGGDEAALKKVGDCFGVLLSLLKRVQASALGGVVDAVCAAIADDLTAPAGEGQAAAQAALDALKLRLLGSVYHSCAGGERFGVYRRIVAVAASTGHAAGLTASPAQVKKQLEDWGVPLADKRAVVLALANALAAADGGARAEDARKLLYMYVASFNGAPASELAGVAPQAAQLAKGACAQALEMDQGLLGMDAVQHLANVPEHASLHELLQVFLLGKLAEFDAFVARHGEAGLRGLDKTRAETHMRLLSLCSLACEYEAIPYKVIAETLRLEPGEVETWIMKAIVAKLVTGRMDQLREVVHVSASTQRVFDETQWANLKRRLDGWRRDLQELVDEVEKQARAPRVEALQLAMGDGTTPELN